MSSLPQLTLLPPEEKFNGTNLLQWKKTIAQLLGMKGLEGYVDGSISKPSPPLKAPEVPPTATPVYSSTPSVDEWTFRDRLAQGHITLNCTNMIGLGVVDTGTAKEAWDSILAEYGKGTDMRLSHAQDILNQTIFVEGSDIQEHIELLRMRKSAVDNYSASPMSDETWRGLLIRSIPPSAKWLPVIPSLYLLSSSLEIVSTLTNHSMILARDPSSKSSSQSNTALAAKSPRESCGNPQCKAKNKATHTWPNFYWPGGGKEGQFPPNFGQKSKANAATTTNPTTEHSATSSTVCEHFALSAMMTDTPGQSGILIDDDPEDHPHLGLISKAFKGFEQGKIPTFIDSGTSDTMFVSKDVFKDYTPIVSRIGDSAKAKDGGFEIIGEGSVLQRYKVDGKERDITYTRALHTPTLNANLVSVSALDKAGLTVTFGNGQGIARKPDGKVVLSGKGVNGMYLLESVDNPPSSKAMATSSLSKPTTLEQWHRRLTHCSPLTIKDMASKNLVDGLTISGDIGVRGK